MKRKTFWIVLMMHVFCVSHAAQNSVGMITDLDGTGRLRQPDGKEIKLNERNYGMNLYAGQRLRADGNGRIEIRLCNDSKPQYVRSKWYQVRDTICPAPIDSAKEAALEERFIVGGRYRRRGGDGFILFPIEAKNEIDIVRPETVVFRWEPVSTKVKVNLSVSVVGAENKTWTQNDVPGEDGFFTDDNLRKFLEDVREHYPQSKLQLTIRTSSPSKNSAIFRLFTQAEEKALQQKIAVLKEDNEMLLHIGRAAIYLQTNLFIEAANEYEEALKLAPDSLDLLNATAAMQDNAGVVKRSEELESYLEEVRAKMNY